MSRLDEIKARWEAATPGPWEEAEHFASEEEKETHSRADTHGWQHHPCGDIEPCVISSWGHDADGVDISVADANFIAHAPDDMGWLLSQVHTASVHNKLLMSDREQQADFIAKIYRAAKETTDEQDSDATGILERVRKVLYGIDDDQI